MRNENNKDEEFVLNFDEDVVDMTNINSTAKNSYTTNNEAKNEYDPYGVYDPYGAYNSNNDSTRQPFSKPVSKFEKLSFILIIIAELLPIIFILYFIMTKFTLTSYYTISLMFNIIIYIFCICDSIVLKVNYYSTYQIFIAILLPGIYPFFAFKIRKKSLLFPILILVLSFLLVFPLAKKISPLVIDEYKYAKTSSDTYDAKYNKPMEKFKALNVSSENSNKMIDVINSYIRDYDFDITTDIDASYIITVTGTTKIYTYSGYQNCSAKISFKMNSIMTGYSIYEMIIDGEKYNLSDAQAQWNKMIK